MDLGKGRRWKKEGPDQVWEETEQFRGPGEWIEILELEKTILGEVIQSQKNILGMYSLISGYYAKISEYPGYNSFWF